MPVEYQNLRVTRSEQTRQAQGEIQRMLPRHYRIMDLALAGHGSGSIGELVGMTKEGVLAVTRSPLFVAEFNRRQVEEQTEAGQNSVLEREARLSKAKMILEEAAEAASGQLVILSKGSLDESIQLRASNSILDRVFGKAESALGPAVQINITTQDVQLLNLALKETGYERTDEPAHDASASTPQDGHSAVHQDSGSASERHGHRQAQDQGLMPPTESVGSMSAPTGSSHPNGQHVAPQPERNMNG